MLQVPKLNPKVGGGIGGLPTREVVDTKVPFSISTAPILNEQYSTITGVNTIINLDFTPVDSRTMGFQFINSDTSDYSSACSPVFFLGNGNQRLFIGTDDDQSYVYYDKNNNRLVFTGNFGDYAGTVRIIEYDMKVKNQHLDISGNVDIIGGALSFNIVNLRNTYCMGYLAAQVSIPGQTGIFPVTYAARADNANNFAAHCSYVRFYLASSSTFDTYNANETDVRFMVIEFEEKE